VAGGDKAFPVDADPYITLDTARRMLRISKRKCAALLREGIIPCTIMNEKKTWRYRIRRSDFEALSKTPERLRAADASSRRRRVASASVRSGRFRKWLEEAWSDVPDVLTVPDVEAMTGYCQTSVCGWITNGKLKCVTVCGRQIISREWLIDFLCGAGQWITRKSEKHRELLREGEEDSRGRIIVYAPFRRDLSRWECALNRYEIEL
jgi:hypothetical protein